MRRHREWGERRAKSEKFKNTAAAVAALPSPRTADATKLVAYVAAVGTVRKAALKLHGAKACRRWRLRLHGAGQRQMHRMAQQAAWGFTSVGAQWAQGAKREQPAPRALPELCIVGWGNASLGHQGPIRRRLKWPCRRFEAFVRAQYPHVVWVNLDEYLTSQVCTSCWGCVVEGRKLHPFADPVHGACYKRRACQGHTTPLVVHRDVSASRALLARLLGLLFGDGGGADGKKVLRSFARPKPRQAPD